PFPTRRSSDLNLTATTPHYNRIRRMSGTGGRPQLWAAPGDYVTVAIDGTWGYSGTVCPTVVEACQIMTSRLYQRAVSHYENDRGIVAEGMSIVSAPKASLDQDVCTLLAPL